MSQQAMRKTTTIVPCFWVKNAPTSPVHPMEDFGSPKLPEYEVQKT